ncbi:unnamed protein product [Linum trigynum]|uniref:Uncharacterized protein n=1 Tax=Linum trigynum TaxID=586398 RepID=A0AAV2FBQ5_9ROSI
MDGNKNNASDARMGRPSTLVILDMEDFIARVAGRGVNYHLKLTLEYVSDRLIRRRKQKMGFSFGGNGS